MRGLGYIPDPRHLERGDKRFAEHYGHLLGGVLPEEDLHLVEHVQGILDQGQAEQCAGVSIAQDYQIALSSEGHDPVLPSGSFLWWGARKSLGDDHLNMGTYIYAVVQAAKDLGLPPDADWKTTEAAWRFAERPDDIAFKHGYDAKFELDVFRVGQTKDEVKAAVAVGPVTFGTAVTKAFTETGPHTDPIPPPADGADIAGGHAMTIAGYDKYGVRVPNTWGTGLGNAGWFYLSWEYVLSDWTSELVCVRYVPKLVK